MGVKQPVCMKMERRDDLSMWFRRGARKMCVSWDSRPSLPHSYNTCRLQLEATARLRVRSHARDDSGVEAPAAHGGRALRLRRGGEAAAHGVERGPVAGAAVIGEALDGEEDDVGLVADNAQREYRANRLAQPTAEGFALGSSHLRRVEEVCHHHAAAPQR